MEKPSPWTTNAGETTSPSDSGQIFWLLQCPEKDNTQERDRFGGKMVVSSTRFNRQDATIKSGPAE